MSRGSRKKDEKEKSGAKPWGGRFSEATDPTVERFSASIHYDRTLARHDIRGSRAQARMLGRSGLIPAEDSEALLAGLDQVAREIEEGSFPFDPALEDIHMNIESRLRTLIGPVAGKLHTGRSRNDQVATDLALYLREVGLETERALLGLRGVLLERARENVDTILPGYTHLQRAQPVRLAHQWLAHIETLGRDASRFRDGRRRIKSCPLGAGALAGSTLPLDREQTAAELGFEGPTRNSMDTVASRDGALEYLANTAICMVHLSRLAEELVLWSSAEFGFVELADAYSTGSSLMPQKKNPDVPELVRGKSGRAIGNLVTLLTVLKGLPLTYNRDLQEDKEPLFDSAGTILDSLEVMSGAIATLRVRRERMAEAASDPMLLATDLAEILVKAGIPFRDAHEVVGKIVGHCTREGLSLRALSRAQMQSFHPAFEAGSDALLELERSLESRTLAGGTARIRVEAALETADREIREERAAIDADSKAVGDARADREPS